MHKRRREKGHTVRICRVREREDILKTRRGARQRPFTGDRDKQNQVRSTRRVCVRKEDLACVVQLDEIEGKERRDEEPRARGYTARINSVTTCLSRQYCDSTFGACPPRPFNNFVTINERASRAAPSGELSGKWRREQERKENDRDGGKMHFHRDTFITKTNICYVKFANICRIR